MLTSTVAFLGVSRSLRKGRAGQLGARGQKSGVSWRHLD